MSSSTIRRLAHSAVGVLLSTSWASAQNQTSVGDCSPNINDVGGNVYIICPGNNLPDMPMFVGTIYLTEPSNAPLLDFLEENVHNIVYIYTELAAVYTSRYSHWGTVSACYDEYNPVTQEVSGPRSAVFEGRVSGALISLPMIADERSISDSGTSMQWIMENVDFIDDYDHRIENERRVASQVDFYYAVMFNFLNPGRQLSSIYHGPGVFTYPISGIFRVRPTFHGGISHYVLEELTTPADLVLHIEQLINAD